MKYHVEFDIDFRRNPYEGLYIVLEGINACGKTTQVEALKNYFEKRGREVVETREPNDALVIGKFVREQILTGKVKLPGKAMQYLYTADRIVNQETIIIPALQEGKVVLSSRGFWSSVVYGILDKGDTTYTNEDANRLLVAQGVLSMFHKFIIADYNFYLSVSLETIMKRMEAMGNTRDLYEKKEKLSQLINGYDFLTKQFKKEFSVIDAEKSIADVTKSMVQILEQFPKRI